METKSNDADFYSYSINELKEVFTNSGCPFDEKCIQHLPSDMKKMWDCLKVDEKIKFNNKKCVEREILPSWHEINTLYYFKEVLHLDYTSPKDDTGPDLFCEEQNSYIECKLIENPDEQKNQNHVKGYPKIDLNNFKSGWVNTSKLALKFTSSIKDKKDQLENWFDKTDLSNNSNFSLSFNSWLLTFDGLWCADHVEEIDKILRNKSNPSLKIYSNNETGEIVNTYYNPAPDRKSIQKNEKTFIDISSYNFSELPFENIFLSAKCPFQIPKKEDFSVFNRSDYVAKS